MYMYVDEGFNLEFDPSCQNFPEQKLRVFFPLRNKVPTFGKNMIDPNK